MREIALLDAQYRYLIIDEIEQGFVCLFTNEDDKIGITVASLESIYTSVVAGVMVADPYEVLG